MNSGHYDKLKKLVIWGTLAYAVNLVIFDYPEHFWDHFGQSMREVSMVMDKVEFPQDHKFDAFVEYSIRYFLPVFLNFVPAVFIVLITVLLVYALSAVLSCELAGGIAAVVAFKFVIINPLYRSLLDREQIYYCITVLLSAIALVRYIISPSAIRRYILGASIAMSLMIRSPLFLFLPVLVCYEAVTERSRFKMIHVIQLFSIPVLVMLLWGFLQHYNGFKPQFFQGNRAAGNVIQGALGIIETTEGHHRVMAGIPEGASILRWSINYIFHHPFIYVHGFMRRCIYVFEIHPLLTVMAFFGFLRFRARKGFRTLFLLAIYFLTIHCLMAVQLRYLIPLWLIITPVAVMAVVPGRFISKQDINAKLPLIIGNTVFIIFAVEIVLYLSMLCVSSADCRRLLKHPEYIEKYTAAGRGRIFVNEKLGKFYLKQDRIREAKDISGRNFIKVMSGEYDQVTKNNARDIYAMALLSGEGRNFVCDNERSCYNFLFIFDRKLRFSKCEDTALKFLLLLKHKKYEQVRLVWQRLRGLGEGQVQYVKLTERDDVLFKQLKTATKYDMSTLGYYVNMLPVGTRRKLFDNAIHAGFGKSIAAEMFGNF